VKNLMTKYQIRKLLTISTDVSNIKSKVLEYQDNLQNIQPFVLNQYDNLR